MPRKPSEDQCSTVGCKRHREAKRTRCAGCRKEAYRAKQAFDPCDPWLLEDDGITDPIAVGIAVRGEHLVRLTAPERVLAARRIVADGGTPQTLLTRLSLPNMGAAVILSALVYVSRTPAA